MSVILSAAIGTIDVNNWVLVAIVSPIAVALAALAVPALAKRIGEWQDRRRLRRDAAEKALKLAEEVAQLKEDMADVLVCLKGFDDPISGHHSPGLVDTLDAVSTLIGRPDRRVQKGHGDGD